MKNAQKTTGYKNLISHLASHHPGYVEVAEKCFRRTPMGGPSSEAMYEAVAKKARTRTKISSVFVETSWTTPTSVIVERFFSQVKLMLGYLRKSMKAETLEHAMFLKLNWDLVSLGAVSKAIINAKDTEDEAT